MLEIAIERFNLATGRFTLEDHVIDLAIALESTICSGSGGEQLSYRFRIFGAATLADSVPPEDSRMVLKRLYDVRSKIVHHGKRLADFDRKDLLGLPPHDFVGKCRDLTRLILLEFLDQATCGRSPKQFVEDLERVMIASAKTKLSENQTGAPEAGSMVRSVDPEDAGEAG